jgi:hypothetical protein
VISERNLSKNTQRSYRDTFSILLPWISNPPTDNGLSDRSIWEFP